MRNKRIELNFSSPELSQKYSNLILREIPLSATGVTSRVYFYLKDKKLVGRIKGMRVVTQKVNPL